MTTHVLRPDSPTVLANRFQLLRELGSGGYGVVYEAIDIEWGSRVALKTLQRMEPDALLRFKEEFRALQDLEHPNLVHLEELTCADGLWFFTMELIEGTDFFDYVRPRSAELSYLRIRALDERKLRAALLQLLEALAAIHASGRVHCDIKPSNIRVDASGRLALLDFGLVSGGKLSLSSEFVFGTPTYMAPEQCRGDPISPATDLYSAGVLLYEALTGDVPYVGDAKRVVLEKQHRAPPDPAQVFPDVPPDLAALCLRLLAIDPAQRPSARELVDTLTPHARAVLFNLPEQTPFVGRAQQLAWLTGQLAQSADGRPSFSYVSGDSGVGKSALVAHFAALRRAQDGALVLRGRCFERETVPYKALDGIVDDLAVHLAELHDAQAEALLPSDAKLLVQVFPVLSRVRSIDALPAPRALPDFNVQRDQTFGALREILARLCLERPLLLLIDDLHWSDLDSMAWLGDLLAAPDAPRCMVVATGRSPSELSGEVGVALAQILTGAGAAELALTGLDEDDAAELGKALARRRDDSQMFRTIAREARGHPLFVAELVRHVESGHALDQRWALDDALRTRVANLDPAGRALLEVMAVAGTPSEHAVLMHALGLTPSGLARRLAQLRVQRLARSESRQRAECYHERVRRAVLEGLPEPARRQRHRVLAQALSSLVSDNGERVAYQWRCAGEDAKAARYFADAAATAFRALAFRQATRLYAEALAQPDEFSAEERFDLLVDQARALSCAGFSARAAEVYLEAASLRAGEDARALRRQATLLMLRSGRIQEGLQLADDLLHEVGLSRPSTPTRAVVRLLWERARMAGQGLDSLQDSERASAEPEVLELLWAVAPSLAFVDVLSGSALQSTYVRMALRSGDVQHVVRSLTVEAMARANLDRPPQEHVSRILARVRQIADGKDNPYLRALMVMSHGYVHWMNFRLHEATAQLVQAERLLRESCVDASWELTNARIALLNALWNSGKLWKHDELARDWQRDARDRGDRYAGTQLLCVGLGYQLSLRHDLPEAAEQALDDCLKGWPDAFQLPHWCQHIGRLLVELYNDGDAYELWQTNWPRLRRSQLLRARYLALLSYLDAAWVTLHQACRAGRTERAELLREALHYAQKVEQTKRPLASALADQIRAQALLLHGQRDQAALLLRRAEVELRAQQSVYQYPTAHLLGTLLAGDEGKLYCTRALNWAADENIADPARWFSMFVPVLREQ
jgi:eukaryotic-like serine/threonine-protein kinase